MSPVLAACLAASALEDRQDRLRGVVSSLSAGAELFTMPLAEAAERDRGLICSDSESGSALAFASAAGLEVASGGGGLSGSSCVMASTLEVANRGDMCGESAVLDTGGVGTEGRFPAATKGSPSSLMLVGSSQGATNPLPPEATASVGAGGLGRLGRLLVQSSLEAWDSGSSSH